MWRLPPLATFALLFACGCQTTPTRPNPGLVASAQPASSSRVSAAPSASAAPAGVDASAPPVPLGPPGATIAHLQDGPTDYSLVLTEAGKTTTFAVAFSLPYSPEKAVYRYVDVDGDGRADTVLFFPAAAGDESTGGRLASGTVVLTPPQGQQPTDAPLQADLAASVLAVGAANVDEVVARAKAIPNRGVTAVAACALTSHARTKAGFRAVTTPDAQLITYTEPGDRAIDGRVVTLADLDKPDPDATSMWPLTEVLSRIGREPCKEPLNHPQETGCNKSRPACGFGQADGDAWVFAWTPSGEMRLQAVAFMKM